MEGTGQQKGAPFPLGTAPLSGYREQKPYGILLNVQPPAGRNGGGVLLGQRQLQHTVFVTAADLLALDVGDVKAAAKRPIRAFPAHIAVFVILFLGLRIPLGGDGPQRYPPSSCRADRPPAHNGRLCP